MAASPTLEAEIVAGQEQIDTKTQELADTDEKNAQAKEDVEGSFVDSVSFALCVWPVVHPFSFRYVPLEHRLLVLNACSLVTFSFATFVKGSQPCEDDVCDAKALQRRRTIAAAAAAAG